MARVLVTRPPGSWPGLAARLAPSGITIEMAATTEQIEPTDPRPGDEAIAHLDDAAWLVVTSGQGVKALVLRLAARGRAGLPRALRIAAVGPATAEALEGIGAVPELVAADPRSAGLEAELAARVAPGARVIVVRPEGGPATLASSLRAAGLRVEEAPLYRTVVSARAGELAEAAIAGRFAGVAFTAPSSVDLWLDAAAARREALVEALARTSRVAIGPTTAARLRALRLRAKAVAAAPTEGAVADAIARAMQGAC